MTQTLQELDELIQRKVDEGLFPSKEAAMQAIVEWLDRLEHDFFLGAGA